MAKRALYLEADFHGGIVAWTYGVNLGLSDKWTKKAIARHTGTKTTDLIAQYKKSGWGVNAKNALHIPEVSVLEAMQAERRESTDADIAAATTYLNGTRMSYEYDALTAGAKQAADSYKRQNALFIHQFRVTCGCC